MRRLSVGQGVSLLPFVRRALQQEHGHRHGQQQNARYDVGWAHRQLAEEQRNDPEHCPRNVETQNGPALAQAAIREPVRRVILAGRGKRHEPRREREMVTSVVSKIGTAKISSGSIQLILMVNGNRPQLYAERRHQKAE